MSNVAQSPAKPRPIDKDSIYYSKERWRLIPQRLDRFTVQYLVIDTYENEIVGTHPKMSEAMDHRDRLEGRVPFQPAASGTQVDPEMALPSSNCEELAHE
jgi:hypothetical protein